MCVPFYDSYASNIGMMHHYAYIRMRTHTLTHTCIHRCGRCKALQGVYEDVADSFADDDSIIFAKVTYIGVSGDVYRCAHKHMHTYMHTYAHTGIHVHIYIHTNRSTVT